VSTVPFWKKRCWGCSSTSSRELRNTSRSRVQAGKVDELDAGIGGSHGK
jgi:hypothetical protein